MSEEIQNANIKFKQKNGNIVFTTKELVIAIYEKLDQHERMITKNSGNILFNKATGVILTIIITGLCLKLIMF